MHLSASQESQISHRFFFSASSAPLCVKSLSLFHSFTLSLFHSFTLSLFHSFTLSLFHSFTLSLFHSFTLSLFHSFTLSLFHSFTLSLFSSTVPKQNHIPLLHHIFLPLQSHLRLLPRCPQASRRH